MCWGGGGGDGVESRGSEFNIDWKGVDCGVSTGSEAMVDSNGVSVRVTPMSIGVSASIWIPLVWMGAPCGVVVGRDRGCEVGCVLILCCFAAGAVTGAVVRGQAGLLVVSMGVTAGAVEPKGRRRRLAAWASSAEETSWFGTGMAWKQRYRVRNYC